MLPRTNSIKQLNRARKACDKKNVMGKGDIGSKSDGDLKGANVLYVHEVPSKMRIDTYDKFTNPKGEGHKTAKHMNDLHKVPENNTYNMKNLISFNEHCNTIDLLRIGKQIEFGSIKGYINKIEGPNVWVEVLGHDEVEGKLEKFSLVEIAKKLKVD